MSLRVPFANDVGEEGNAPGNSRKNIARTCVFNCKKKSSFIMNKPCVLKRDFFF